jgi:hypothetical protein
VTAYAAAAAALREIDIAWLVQRSPVRTSRRAVFRPADERRPVWS